VVLDLALPLALYMGFETIILIGVDFSWGQDNWHFYSDEQDPAMIDAMQKLPGHDMRSARRVFESRLPIPRMFACMGEARRVVESMGRSILNATAGGNLDVIPRTDYESLFTRAASR